MTRTQRPPLCAKALTSTNKPTQHHPLPLKEPGERSAARMAVQPDHTSTYGDSMTAATQPESNLSLASPRRSTMRNLFLHATWEHTSAPPPESTYRAPYALGLRAAEPSPRKTAEMQPRTTNRDIPRDVSVEKKAATTAGLPISRPARSSPRVALPRPRDMSGRNHYRAGALLPRSRLIQHRQEDLPSPRMRTMRSSTGVDL